MCDFVLQFHMVTEFATGVTKGCTVVTQVGTGVSEGLKFEIESVTGVTNV